MKSYDLGMVCGRFGHFHLGHAILVNTCMNLSKQTLILVGSAQESGTLRNPFGVQTRIDVIKKAYSQSPENVLMVRAINDLTNEFGTSTKWGTFLISETKRHTKRFADLMVYGNDERRSQWFEDDDLANTAEFILPRSKLQISATKVRGMLLIGDKSGWQEATLPSTHLMYERLREELMIVPIYKQIYNSIRHEELSLENFMRVYKRFEIIDRNEKLAKLKNDTVG